MQYNSDHICFLADAQSLMRSGGFTSGSSNDKDAMVCLFLPFFKASASWSMFASDVIATKSLQVSKPWGEGRGTPIVDLTGCTAQQGVLLR